MDHRKKERVVGNLDEMEEILRNIKSLIFMTTFDKEDTISILMEEAGVSIIDAMSIIENKVGFDETRAHLELSRVEAILHALVDQIEYYLQIIEKNEEKRLLHSFSSKFIEKVLDSIEILYSSW